MYSIDTYEPPIINSLCTSIRYFVRTVITTKGVKLEVSPKLPEFTLASTGTPLTPGTDKYEINKLANLCLLEWCAYVIHFTQTVFVHRNIHVNKYTVT